MKPLMKLPGSISQSLIMQPPIDAISVLPSEYGCIRFAIAGAQAAAAVRVSSPPTAPSGLKTFLHGSQPPCEADRFWSRKRLCSMFTLCFLYSPALPPNTGDGHVRPPDGRILTCRTVKRDERVQLELRSSGGFVAWLRPKK